MEGVNVMNNYYNIVTKILEIAKKHIFIKEAHYGDIYEFHNSGNRNYSTFVLTQGENNQINENYTQYNFTAFVTDRLTDDEKNLLEVQSNCATILNQIMIEIQDSLEYFSESETMSFWKEKFNDLCAGCFIQFSLQVPNDYICNNDIFMPKTLTITKNGEYSVVGYDTALVDVHSTDVFNYFTLYPSNYIYANYLDLSTEIVANVKFTGDEDFYFCSDEKGLIGLYFNAEENETYAWWNGDRKALHFHKKDWEKGFYKIQFKAGRLQIGYLTWTLESNSSTTSFDPLYFGYYKDKTSPMEIEYITISNQYGAAYDYRPKITDEYAELVEVISGKNADIRTVYSQEIYNEDVLTFLNNGGTFAAYKGTEMPKIDWEMVTITDWSNFFRNAKNISLRNVNFSNAEKVSYICTETTIIDTELHLDMPKLTEMSYAYNYVYGNLKKLTIDAPNLITNNNQFNYCNTIEELSLLNTTKMKLMNYSFTNCTNLRKLSAIQCESLIGFSGLLNGKQPKLEDFGGFVNIGKSVPVDLVFTLAINNAPNLTHQSLLNVLNGLYDLTALRRSQPLRLQLGEANYNKLTEDEIKIATDKGWTVMQ